MMTCAPRLGERLAAALLIPVVLTGQLIDEVAPPGTTHRPVTQALSLIAILLALWGLMSIRARWRHQKAVRKASQKE